MKEHASFLLALVSTAFAASANLGAVVADNPGAPALLLTLCITALWLTGAVVCQRSRALCCALLALMLCVAGISALALIPALRELQEVMLVWSLAVAPFYGFGALCQGIEQTVPVIFAVCMFTGFFSAIIRRQRLLRQDADIIALEREALNGGAEPDLADRLDRKSKRLLGLHDPEVRLSRSGGKTGVAPH